MKIIYIVFVSWACVGDRAGGEPVLSVNRVNHPRRSGVHSFKTPGVSPAFLVMATLLKSMAFMITFNRFGSPAHRVSKPNRPLSAAESPLINKNNEPAADENPLISPKYIPMGIDNVPPRGGNTPIAGEPTLPGSEPARGRADNGLMSMERTAAGGEASPANEWNAQISENNALMGGGNTLTGMEAKPKNGKYALMNREDRPVNGEDTPMKGGDTLMSGTKNPVSKENTLKKQEGDIKYDDYKDGNGTPGERNRRRVEKSGR